MVIDLSRLWGIVPWPTMPVRQGPPLAKRAARPIADELAASRTTGNAVDPIALRRPVKRDHELKATAS